MLNYNIIKVLFLTIILTQVISQNQVIAQTNWTIFNTSNSELPNDQLFAIAIDVNGHIWAGTHTGAAKFNGNTWITYNSANSALTDGRIRSIIEDDNGNMWFGTHSDGLAKFDGSEWTIYDTLNSDLPDNTVPALATGPDNELWIGTWNGLAVFDGSDWTNFTTSNSDLPHNEISSLNFALNGDLWIGTYGGGIAIFDSTDWTIYNSSNSELPEDRVYEVAFAENGDKWIGTYGGGLVSLAGNNNWTVYNAANSDLGNNNIYTVKIDVNGDKWIGTQHNGLYKFDGTDWTEYSTANSALPGNIVSDIVIAENGDVLIGLIGDGFVILGNGVQICQPPSDFTIWSTSNSSVELSWTSNNTNANYSFIYGPSGFNPQTQGTYQNGTSETGMNVLEISGLSDNETYDIYLSESCHNGKESVLIGPKTFSTISVGINELTDTEIEIYPNPVVDKLRIKTPASTIIQSIDLYCMLGSHVKKQTQLNASNSIDLSNLPEGTYIVKIRTDKALIRKKIIKL